MLGFFCRRGIPAQPILNGYCGNYEPGMAKSMINDPIFNYEDIDLIDLSTAATLPGRTSTLSASTPVYTDQPKSPANGLPSVFVTALSFAMILLIHQS